MELQGKIINFLGDSITEGCGTTGIEKRFTEIIQKNHNLCKANNYGIGGTRFARKRVPSENPKWDEDFCSRVEGMDENADIIVVFGGTNDFGHGDAPIGAFEDKTNDTFYGACRVLMESLLNKYPGKPIIFLTPLHREDEEKPNGEKLAQYVDIIKETARYYALPVCDLYAESGIQPRLPVIKEKFFPDGLHPNDAGHLILAQKIAGYLIKL